jgi:cephalosporin-C deacetylase-like acetyl esterase
LERSPDESPLDYFDVANFARLVKCPARVSVGLLDKTAPPDSILAMYNEIPGEKILNAYYTGDHECRVEDKPYLLAWLEEIAAAAE